VGSTGLANREPDTVAVSSEVVTTWDAAVGTLGRLSGLSSPHQREKEHYQ